MLVRLLLLASLAWHATFYVAMATHSDKYKTKIVLSGHEHKWAQFSSTATRHLFTVPKKEPKLDYVKCTTMEIPSTSGVEIGLTD